MTPIVPITIDQTGSNNPAGLSPAEVTKLTAGGPPAKLKLVYPYDGTVFPAGTIAPLVMWTGNPAPDAVYLHIKSQAFEYKGALKPAIGDALFVPGNSTAFGPGINAQSGFAEANKQLAIPQMVWDAATKQTMGKADPFLLEITERVNGQVYGPIGAHITIARGAIQGSIYYNTCFALSSDGATTLGSVLGTISRVVRIPPGGKAEALSSSSQCVGCHSVSANGSRLIAQRALDDLSAPKVSALSASLGSDGKFDANKTTNWGTMGAFGALYPDGSKFLAPSGNAAIVADANQVMPLAAAALFDAITGAAIPDTGIPDSASMPNFSPDGTHLVFNDTKLGAAHGLAVMNYDTHTNKASDYKVLLQDDPNGKARPGWPFMLPDNRAVVFVQSSSLDFTSGLSHTNINDQLRGDATYPSDLYIADIAQRKLTILAKAMGFNTEADASGGTTYLEYGKEQLHRNYFPTVSPVASGGYFWVFFSSLRHFGTLGPMNALWGAAIDIHPDGSYTADPSHPAFYVSGQEFINTSHHRAFAALDACQPNGSACETGINCCDGRCTGGVCSQPPPPEEKTCANQDERCATPADCCDSTNFCINNFCALVPLL
jgi:hypothetical protein